MRVLFDVSVFGTIAISPGQPVMRTGVCRFAEHFATAMVDAPDCEFTLCAATRWSGALTHAEAYLPARATHFAVPARKMVAEQFRRRVVAGRERGDSAGTLLPARVGRRLMVEFNRLADRNVSDPTTSLDQTVLAGADIFHSPFYPLPEIVQQTRGLQRFITIHDVIPILRPDFFSWPANVTTRAALDSVREDGWILTISHATKADVLSVHSIAPERVQVVHLAADPDRFYRCDDTARMAAVRQRYGVPDAPYILSVGTLEPRKNLPHLVRTFAELVQAERIGDLHLVLTGGKGWHYEQIFEEASRFEGLRERIIFTGYVDDDDLAPLYSGALVFVYPSIYEGFGLPPLEAMQCGAPTITSNTSSLPEVVGDAAIMVDPHDGDALAQALLDVYDSAERRAEMSRRALERAAQFSWTRCAAETIAAYRRAL